MSKLINIDDCNNNVLYCTLLFIPTISAMKGFENRALTTDTVAEANVWRLATASG